MAQKMKIIIADDSVMNRALLADMLDDQYEIIEAENGMEVAAILQNQENEISLILLDIVMPVMDGFDLLALMNKKGWIKTIPVIIISSENGSAYIDRAYGLGATEYISRPFDERIVKHRVVSSIMLTTKQKELTGIITQQMYESEKTNRIMVEILSNIVEFRNGESGLHVLHIQTITELILDRLLLKTKKYNISVNDRNLICNASALHDIGKIAIPSEILNKPGKLTAEEFEIVKTHSEEGARVIRNVPLGENEPLMKYAYQICRWHHERYDGKGYPDGLTGDEIPIAAQVVGLADAYDALVSKRAYKDAYTSEKAVQMILNGECGAFNPILMDVIKELTVELSDQIYEASMGHYAEKEIMKSVDEKIKSSNIEASDRTFRLLERERMKFNFVTEMSGEIIFEYFTSPEMITFTEWSASYLGIPSNIIRPRDSKFILDVFGKEQFEEFLNKLHRATYEKPMVDENYILNIGGNDTWSKIVVKTLWSDAEVPELTGAIGKIVDISETMDKIESLERTVKMDSLTGLLNHKTARANITDHLTSNPEKRYVFMLFDIDNFKDANDTYGHLFGDQVLKNVSETIKDNVRKSDIVSRIGGDEFVVFMEYKGDPRTLAERIFSNVTHRYKDFDIKISMGVSLSVECNGEYEKLFNMADTAMYDVKYNGKNGYRVYNEDMVQRVSILDDGVNHQVVSK